MVLHFSILLGLVLQLLALLTTVRFPPPADARKADDVVAGSGFELPCRGYRRGLRGKGNFGVLVEGKRGANAFAGTYHLAEDVGVRGGTKVRSVANGRVVYSDFSPSWKDDEGRMHWNLGNVIVIEHALATPETELTHVCSVYIHLGADRRVKRGDEVTRGQLIGFVGQHRSEENGRYPAHLHFGLHRGRYHQISPAWKRGLVRDAREYGLPFGPDRALVRGEIEVKRVSDTTVRIEFVKQDARGHLSLLVASTSPDYRPADIMGWCQGYGDRETVAEWIRPSAWLKDHAARN